MPCYHSNTGWQHASGGPLKFGRTPPSPGYQRLQVPCGQCIGCRLEYSRQWAMRCVLEARMHTHNCFITLTYNEDHLPDDLSLNKDELTRFFKRLRKQKGPFRYYACGEYGDQTKRAHYHACLFGIDFDDKRVIEKRGEITLYTSAELEKIWGCGNVSIGELNFETAAYCARYVLKKNMGGKAPTHNLLDHETGELIPVIQPYAVMSLGRKKGEAIGGTWLQKYHGDIYNAEKDFLVIRGKKQRPAKYFDKLFDTINPEKMKKIKENRKENHTPLTLKETRAHEKNARARLINRKKV